MPVTTKTVTGGPAQRHESPARRRVLDAANALFYAEGIHAVGIDRVIAEAGVAKATFYHHFPSKDDLVCAYLKEQDSRIRHATALLEVAPEAQIMRLFEVIGEISCGPGFRGCAFVNAAAEYPDHAHPVRQVIAAHRRWFRDLLRGLLAAAQHPDAERTAAMLVLLRDGLVIGGDLDDPAQTRALVRAAVSRVLGEPA
jgi:AcrR family transcriptional regulator